ncbi:MAG: STAS domain-containing protein [Clostridia bacterium]|nr:STAS domain-containing protein [Clostridia bacterium]
MIGIDFINDSKTVVVKINEEIDHHTCEKIKNKIDLAIEFRGARFLIFDFEGVNFMDSSGIGMVLGRY